MKEYFRQKEEFDDKKPHSLTLPPDVRPKEKILTNHQKLTYSQEPVTNQSPHMSYGVMLYNVYLETNPYTRIQCTPPFEDHYEDKQVQ